MILLSPWVVLSALLVYLLVAVVQSLRSPLARLPGPWHTLLSSLPLKQAEFRAQRTNFIHALHLLYGPVVRIGPNEVSFTSTAAIKEIYCSGGSGYDKSGFYNLFTVYGRRTMFSTLEKDPHAQRKRLLADRYANSNVTRGESIEGIEERSRRFTQRITDTSSAMGVDIYTALHSYAFDCASHHIFHPLGADSLRNPRDERIMLEVTTDSSLQNRLVRLHAPMLHRVMEPLLNLLTPPRETPLADEFVLEAAGRADEARPFTLVSRLGGDAKGRSSGNELDEVTVAAECLDHMVAGIDTTGDALCFLMWELSQPRSMAYQERLRAEVRQAVSQGEGWEKLPFLDAVVMEGLRCFPAIPMSLPRLVPLGGRIIDGYNLPEGTVVSSQAYSVHRLDGTVFPDPDNFSPDRWLRADGGDAERKRAFFAFANGGRGCVGKHLALAEMKILLRDVYAQYQTIPGESMTEDMMVMEDQLISSRPLAQKCMLRFVTDEKGAGVA